MCGNEKGVWHLGIYTDIRLQSANRCDNCFALFNLIIAVVVIIISLYSSAVCWCMHGWMVGVGHNFICCKLTLNCLLFNVTIVVVVVVVVGLLMCVIKKDYRIFDL